MNPKAQPPIGSVNNTPVYVPPPFDMAWREVQRERSAWDAWAFGGVLLLVLATLVAGVCDTYSAPDPLHITSEDLP
jgi:hypothetical protein